MTKKRDAIFDFIKGVFVVGMVGYHSLNYFVQGYTPAYEYFSYVAQGFIFLSGFMCGAFYYTKYRTDRGYVISRLFTRAGKLIVIFLSINLLMGFLSGRFALGGHSSGVPVTEWMISTLFKGNPYSASFDILVPIAYVLVISLLFFRIPAGRFLPAGLAVVLYLFLSIVGFELGYNLSCILVGIGGITIGMLYQRITRILDNRYFKMFLAGLIAVIMLLLIPGGFNVRTNILSTYAYICIVIVNLYTLGRLLNLDWYLGGSFTLMGRYSLMLYIAQIMILRLASRAFPVRWPEPGAGLWLIVFSTSLSMVIIGAAVDMARKRSRLIDSTYRLVFS